VEENGALYVEYARIENGKPRYDRDGPFAAKSVAEQRWKEFRDTWISDAPEDAHMQIAGMSKPIYK
jgi:hypothetical protein